MKFVVYREKSAPKEKPPVRLRLQDGGDGSVEVIAVDEAGDRVRNGYIATFCDGHLILHGSVSSDLGLDLDHEGHIITEVE
jgi:hypothetical protein